MRDRRPLRSARGSVASRILIAVGIVVVAAVAAWFFLIRSDAEPKPEIVQTETVAGGSVDGTWVVRADDGTDSFVQYRINETFAAGLAANTATGRTGDVTATMEVTGTEVSNVEVTADLSTLKSDRDFRDNALKSRGLETDRFPEATFRASSVTLPAAPQKGATRRVDVTGDLTLHGVTREVTIPLEGRWDGERIQVVGELEIQLADYGIDPPSGGPVADIEDHGTLELNLFFRKAA